MPATGTSRRPQTLAGGEGRGDAALRYAAVLLLVGFLFHNGDHVRRGFDVITPQVMWLGTAGAVLTVAAVTLVLFRHRAAPQVAVVVGITMALGLVAVHLLPHWSVFSDSLPDGNVDVLTWVAVLAETAGAVALAAAGLYVLWRRRTDQVHVDLPRRRAAGRADPVG